MPSFTSATPCSTFSRVTKFMRPRRSSGPNSPQFDPGGRCFQRCAIVLPLKVVAADRLGDHDRLVCAFALEGDGPGGLHAAVGELLVPGEREAPADPRARGH